MYLIMNPQAASVREGASVSRNGAPVAPPESSQATPQSGDDQKPATDQPATQDAEPGETKKGETPAAPPAGATQAAPTKGMQGTIQPPMQLEPMKPPLPGEVGGGDELPRDAPAGATLTVLELPASRSAAQVSAAAAKLGGKARAYAISLDSGTAGVLVWVPEKQVAKLIETLGGSAERAARETWSGPPSSRRRKLKEPFEKRLSELELKKQALLVKYLEDAPEVLRVDEDIQTVRQAMAQFDLPASSDGMGVVDVRFVSE